MDWKTMILEAMELARAQTLMAVDGLTEEEMLFQPGPGINHPLWLLGHVADSENGLILSFCKGQGILPTGWHGTFGMGSKPVADPKAYPSRDEVLKWLEKTHVAAVEYVKSLSAEDLDRTPPGIKHLPERARKLFASVGRCITGHVRHESNHAGQISMLRRLMGKPYRV